VFSRHTAQGSLSTHVSRAEDLGKQEKRTALHAIFDLKTSFLKKVHEIKKKSPCCGDSKHIFKLKIAQVIPKKNGF
jgi:hypothetical protein